MKMISAVVLAAGKSVRMGSQKMLMPWGDTTVLGKVIQTLQNAGMDDVVIVTNASIAHSISNLQLPITINNNGEMLTSIQAGLQTLKPSAEAALICLGDQPQVEEGSVRNVCEAFLKNKSNLVVPSYQMRRGHPWIAARALWDDILALRAGQSMREFMNARANEIEYVNVDTPTILQDVDTPEDYLKYKPPM
jgi:molybdenum cofactor cytidylyltransferase